MAKKVLLVGWDAADWKIINPLLDAGKLPALESLINKGVMGNIATLDPPLSPLLWTSIATGKHADKHGILGFTEPAPDRSGIRPITVTSRKCKAVWNILMQAGFRCNVVGWWPTHPAEPINGVMVSNFFQPITGRLDDPWPLPKGAVHPKRLEETLKQLRIHPAELTEAHLLPFIPNAARINQDKDQRLFTVAKILAECATVHSAATWIMENEPWDFMAVYYDSIDHFCHGFMDYHPPRLEKVTEEDFAIYKEVITGAYLFHDMMLDRLLHLAGPETTVLLVSDHGFHSNHLRAVALPNEPASPVRQHRPYGIFCMAGPNIIRDELVFGVTLLDVTPTVLSLFGLPVGKDMDGKVILSAFEKPPDLTVIDSWESIGGACGMHDADLRRDPVAEEILLGQLVELGYAEPPAGNIAETLERSVDESRFYLARVHMNRKHHTKALPILEALYHKKPTEIRYGAYLSQCYEAVGRYDECIATIEKVAATADWPLPQLDLLRGTVHLVRGENREALAALKTAASADATPPRLHVRIGIAYARLGRLHEAEASFRTALALDPETPSAFSGLADACLATRRFKEAADAALNAIGLLYFFPKAHFQLALALERLSMRDRAAEAYEACLLQAPGFKKARRKLISLYRKLGRPTDSERHYGILKSQELNTLSLSELPAEAEKSNFFFAQKDAVPDSQRITVVTGLPRSGTSLMMQMLERGGMKLMVDGVRHADLSNPRGYYEHEKAKNIMKDSSWLADAEGAAVKIVAPLLYHLPKGRQYDVLFMERDLEEIIGSQARMIDSLGAKSSFSQPELANAFSSELIKARDWVTGSPNIRVLFVQYNNLIADSTGEASRVAHFLGTPVSTAAMAAAVDPSLYRVRTAPALSPVC